MRWLTNKVKSYFKRRKEKEQNKAMTQLKDFLIQIKDNYEQNRVLKEKDMILSFNMLSKTPVKLDIDLLIGKLIKVSLFTVNSSAPLQLYLNNNFDEVTYLNTGLINKNSVEDYISYWLTSDFPLFCKMMENSLKTLYYLKSGDVHMNDSIEINYEDGEFLDSNLFRLFYIDYITIILLFLERQYESPK